MSRFSLHKFKIFIANIICSHPVGKIVGFVFNNKIPAFGFHFSTKSDFISNKTKAFLFWNLYEATEIKFIKKYIDKTNNVIELGASIGVVSTIISKSIDKRNKVISLEGNHFLSGVFNENLILNNVVNVELLGGIIDYQSREFLLSTFMVSNDNLTSGIANQDISNKIEAKVFTLRSIYQNSGFTDFTLVSDIEGAEIGFILRENTTLQSCSLLIIELHDTYFENKHYSVTDMKNILVEIHGFKPVDFHGNVWVFKR